MGLLTIERLHILHLSVVASFLKHLKLITMRSSSIRILYISLALVRGSHHGDYCTNKQDLVSAILWSPGSPLFSGGW